MKKEDYQLDIFGNWKKVIMIEKAKKLDKRFFNKKENYNVIKAKYKTD